MRRIVLASTSPYRRELMDRLGLAYQAVAPRFTEQLPPGADPAALVVEQAVGKARSVVADHPDALIIGSDQLVALDERVLGKPGDPERAVAQLQALQGREHRLLTAVAVVDAGDGRTETQLDVSTLRVRNLSEEEIRAYVRRENPIDCAGSYRSEGLGIALFDHLRGDDPTAIVGLPLTVVCRLLGRFGVNALLDPDD